jgi:hypothetical protein
VARRDQRRCFPFCPRDIAVGNHYGSAGFGQNGRNADADAAGGAGNQRHPAGQIEGVRRMACHHSGLC